MPKCRNCKQKVSIFRIHSGFLCPECYEEKKERERQILVDQLSEYPVRVYVTIQGCKAKTLDHRADIGDLFITSGGLVFLPYWQWPSLPNWTVGAAAALAGVGGGLGMMLTRKKEEISANDIAYSHRKRLFGLSIEDRIKKHRSIMEPIVISKDKIIGIEVGNNNIINIAHSDKQFLAIVENADEVKEKIKQLLEGTIIEYEDIEGCNLGIPSPGTIIEQLITGNTHIGNKSDIWDIIIDNKNYFDYLVKGFFKQRKAARKNIEEAIDLIPGRFPEVFKAKTQKGWLKIIKKLKRSNG